MFSMKVYKVFSVPDVRLLFLRDWPYKSQSTKLEMRSVGPLLPETIGLPTRLVLCILVRVQNSVILACDFGLN